MKEKHSELTIVGIILLLVGAFMFFKSVRLYSFDFWRFGAVSTGAIIIALLILDAVLMVACYKPIMKYVFIALLGMLVLSIILGSRLQFTGSLLDLFLMIAPLAVGTGLCLRGYIAAHKNTKKGER
ncbi:MAG: hypothetical protein II038_10870 [Lachnospiraceae bacterium]|nr:hypothetical protein [Lachnospiraceae bacterium]